MKSSARRRQKQQQRSSTQVALGDKGSPSAGSMKPVAEVDTLIVGFGFSVIPLLRLLERDNLPYTIISTGKTIWEKLKEKNKLKFDLVSSFHASYYAEDQVKNGTLQDYFPTATENYEYHMRIMAPFRSKVVDDFVSLVENHENHSMVHTKSGQLYKAKIVVLATGLTRPQNDPIMNFDYDNTTGKTVVFNTIGDTTNMMISKLIPQKNKVILVHNGMVLLDKYIAIDAPGPENLNLPIPLSGIRMGKKYRIDLAQGEAHNTAWLGRDFYRDWIAVAWGSHRLDNWLGRLIIGDEFHMKFPETYRHTTIREQSMTDGSGVANAMSAIKFYPIEMYKGQFDTPQLGESIKKGILLNDMIFWHTEGLVESWRKVSTTFDKENKTVRNADGSKVVSYDILVDGCAGEVPVLPQIVTVYADGRRHKYEYDYRDNYLGVAPKHLNNVFCMGYTRPTTGGLANMTEMQSLMIHKLISDPIKREQMYSNIEERIQKYNETYYYDQHVRNPTDHLVFYGLYTREVADFLGLNPSLRSCLSWNPLTTLLNIRFNYMYPNNAHKFRLEGEYKVDGAKEFAWRVFEFNERQSFVFWFIVSNLLDHMMIYQMLIMMFVDVFKGTQFALVVMGSFMKNGDQIERAVVEGIPSGTMGSNDLLLILLTFIVLSFIAHWVHKNRIVMNCLLSYRLPVVLYGPRGHLQPLLMAYIAWCGRWYWILGYFGIIIVIGTISRQFRLLPITGRFFFQDSKHKEKYRAFWKHYQELYLKVKNKESGYGSVLDP